MDKPQKPFLPFLLGSDENVYSFARAFHERYGIKPAVLCKKQYIPTKYSKIIELYIIEGFDSETVFTEALSRIAGEKLAEYEKLLLVPCSDRYVELTVNNPEVIGRYFANRFITPEQLEKFVTKERFYALCEEYGQRYPKTFVCEYENRTAAPELMREAGIDFPVVVKPANSNSYEYLNSSFEGKKKVFFIDSRGEYDALIANMAVSDYRGVLIIQERIAGDDTNERTMNCFSDANGEVVMMSLGCSVLQEYAPLRMGNYAAILSSNDEILYERIRAFLNEIKYVGFSNFDMKYDARTGEYVLFEINPRQGCSNFFSFAAGCDLAKLLVDVYVNNETPPLVKAGSEILWSSVPKGILLKYVKNPEILAKVKALIKQKKFHMTLYYKKDFSVRRYMRIFLYYLRHYRSFKRYFFDKK